MYKHYKIRRTDSDDPKLTQQLNIEVKVLPWTINLIDIIL